MERKVFYPILWIVSFIIGYIPYAYLRSLDLGLMAAFFGFFLLLFWGAMFIFIFLIYIVYEFKRLPLEPNYENHRKFALVSIFLLLIYIAITTRYSTKLWIFFQGSGSVITPSLVIIFGLFIYFLVYLLLAIKENPGVGKNAVILRFFMAIFLIFALFDLPSQISTYSRSAKMLEKESIELDSISRGDFELCTTVLRPDVCAREIAFSTKNASFCDKISTYTLRGDLSDSRLFCYRQLALRERDEGFCEAMEISVKSYFDDLDAFNSEMDECQLDVMKGQMLDLTEGMTDDEIIEKAKKENKVNICFGIKHSDHHLDCRLAVAKQNTLISCDASLGVSRRKECYLHLAKQDSSHGGVNPLYLTEGMTDGEIMDMAKKEDYKDLCQGIKNVDLRIECYQHFFK